VLDHAPKSPSRPWHGTPEYDGWVGAASEQCWQTANAICGERLVPVLSEYVAALERHGELMLADQARALLLQLSPATADRLLGRARNRNRPHGLTTTEPAHC